MKRIYQLVFISIIILIGILIYFKSQCPCHCSNKKASTIPPNKTHKVIVTEDGKTLYDNSLSEEEVNKKIVEVIKSGDKEIQKLREKGKQEIKKILKEEKDIEKIINKKREEKIKELKLEKEKMKAKVLKDTE